MITVCEQLSQVVNATIIRKNNQYCHIKYVYVTGKIFINKTEIIL
jgi:hypothetical protein